MLISRQIAIFSILQFATDVPAISSNVLTTVVIFLPLSSLWASASTHTTVNRSTSHRSNNTAVGSSGTGYNSASLRHKIFGSGASGYGTSGPIVGARDDNRPGWLSPDSGISMQNNGGVERDLEAQGLDTVVERKG